MFVAACAFSLFLGCESVICRPRVGNNFYNSFNILIRQCMVHREANDRIGNLIGYRQILLLGAGEILIGVEVRNQRIEITATEDALLF